MDNSENNRRNSVSLNKQTELLQMLHSKISQLFSDFQTISLFSLTFNNILKFFVFLS